MRTSKQENIRAVVHERAGEAGRTVNALSFHSFRHTLTSIMTGFDATTGSWVFTANQAGGTFSFSSSDGAVPDGGSALILFGLGLGGLEALRRKLAVA